MKVDFMIIGAQKCATTSLAYQLQQHPQICFSRRKEPHYFSRVKNWQARLPEYHKLFSPTLSQLCGEASTSYTFLPEYPHTPTSLFAYNPEVRLIYLMRDPIKRIESHYGHRILHGRAKNTLESEVLTNPIYMNRSCYGVQTKSYLKLFPPSNLLLLLFEEYVTNVDGTLDKIACFLDIAPTGFAHVSVTPQKTPERRLEPKFRFLKKAMRRAPSFLQRGAQKYLYHTLSQKPECSEGLKHTLWLFLESDVSAIEDILGRRLEMWRREYE